MTTPPDAPLSFAVWVRQQREARGWTQKALAARAGCAEITIQKAEGGRAPSTDLLLTLLQAFAIPPEQQEAYVGWVIGLRPTPPPASAPAPDPPAAEPIAAPSAPAASDLAAELAPTLADQLLAELLPALLQQQVDAAATLETRMLSLLLYDRALARQEAAEWEAYRDQTREANSAVQRHTLLLVGLGCLLGAYPTWGVAGLVVILGGLGAAWGLEPWIALKRMEGLPDRVSQASILITSAMTVSAIAFAVWMTAPLFPLFTQLAPLLLRR